MEQSTNEARARSNRFIETLHAAMIAEPGLSHMQVARRFSIRPESARRHRKILQSQGLLPK